MRLLRKGSPSSQEEAGATEQGDAKQGRQASSEAAE